MYKEQRNEILLCTLMGETPSCSIRAAARCCLSSISGGTVLGFLGFGVWAVVDCVVVGCFCVASFASVTGCMALAFCFLHSSDFMASVTVSGPIDS